MFKPELLLPAGSTETFFAALDGGADAVYLGFKKFNARNRAKNFSLNEIVNIVHEAHLRKRKVFITLNTLIKNAELGELIETLHILSQINPDAVIVQDFASIQLIRKFYKNLKIHTSTQMSSHNQLAAAYFKKFGAERIILSRELNESELKLTAKESQLPVEAFVHGALCYSFSGQCLFSSYLGGNSANRGMCAQVCRRSFKSDLEKSSFFSLKDFQLIDYIPLFSEFKLASLKIEGRMKNAEYVYNTARAYRMAIDDHSKINEAKEILTRDFAREKTAWFMGDKLQTSIAQNSGTGIFAGKVSSITKSGFYMSSEIELKQHFQLRIRNFKDTEAGFVKINSISGNNDNYLVNCEITGISAGDEVYLAGTDSYKVKSSFPDYQKVNFRTISPKQADTLKSTFPIVIAKNNKTLFYLRIAGLKSLENINHFDFTAIFLKLKFSEIEKLKSLKILPELKSKLRIELPKYISAKRVKPLQTIISNLFNFGFRNFVISHISQIEILPLGAKITTNENIFLLNDLSVSFIQQQGIKEYCYPLENDYPNMLRGRDRNGIIPVYFYPELFYSRMPVKSAKTLSDDNGKKYKKSVFNGFTVITDTIPVSVTQNASKFISKGFYKFLIDISHESDISRLSGIIKSLKLSEKIPGTSDFNMKKELH